MRIITIIILFSILNLSCIDKISDIQNGIQTTFTPHTTQEKTPPADNESKKGFIKGTPPPEKNYHQIPTV